MKKITAFLYCLSLTLSAFAQPGSVDPTFNTFDSGNGIGFGSNNAVYATKMQPDGKLLIAGLFETYNDAPARHVNRLLPNGTTDPAFTSHADDVFGELHSLELQADGKILIGGAFTSYDGMPVANICRLNEDGSIDPTFSATVNNMVRHILVQPDGKIVLIGSFSEVNGTIHNDFVRLNADGSTDNTFDSGSGIDQGLVWASVMQTDGRIIVCGPFTFYNGTPSPNFARINTDGTYDATFNVTASGVSGFPGALALQTDGKVLVGGDFNAYAGSAVSNIIRVNADGTLDATLACATPTGEKVNAIAVDASGKIWIGGEFASVNGTPVNRIAKLNTDGSLDAAFDGGSGFDANVTALIASDPSTVYCFGDFSSYDGVFMNYMCKLTGTGDADLAYNPTSGLGGPGCFTTVAPGGEIYVYGQFVYFNDQSVRGIIRLDSGGNFDPTFDAGMGYADLSALSIDASGRLVVAGLIHFEGDPTEYRLCRLNNDGSFDASFSTNEDPGTYVRQITHLADGDLLVAGKIVLPADTVVLQRFNSDGSIDSGFDFDPFANPYATCNSFDVQPDGRIVAGGFFPVPDYSSYESLLRILPDGSIDPSFDTSVVYPIVKKLNVLPDATILFLEEGGGLHKVFADGTADTGFLTDEVDTYGFAVQPNGSILYGGNFNQVGGPVINNVRRCLADGTPDPSFEAQNGVGTTQPVTGITLQEDGNFLLTGYFSSYNGTGKNRIARIVNCISLEDALVSVFVVPSSDTVCVGLAMTQQELLPSFEYSLDGAPFTPSASGNLLMENLCAGFHTLGILNGCGDTLAMPFVIPVDSNYIFNNPFIDSLALDSLGTTIENCDIYYNGIDTAYITNIFANGNTVVITWGIVDTSGINTVTTTYELNNGNGVYYLQLSIFCPQKALGHYFTVTEAIYYAYGEAGLGVNEMAPVLPVAIWPNPSSDLVTLAFPATEAQLTVRDVQGRTIHVGAIISGTQVSLEDQPAGIYLFQLTSSDGSAVKRIVKQ